MKFKSAFLPLLVLSLIIFASTQSTSAVAPKTDNGASARGSGGFTNIGPNRPGVYEFSFEAFANKNGHAHGRAIFDNLSAQTHIEIKIDCLTLADSSNASISGTILHSTDPELPKGTNVLFGAVAAEEVDPPAALDFEDLLVVGAPARQAGAMREEMAEGDVSFAVHAEVVKDPCRAVVDSQLVLADEQQKRGGGGEGLSE